jgi:hypothetical protein
MTDESISIEFTPNRSVRRRIEFVPVAGNPGYWRITSEWTGCRWRETGREHVRDVIVDHTGAFLD